MSGERLEVSVTFEPAKGYVATVPDLAEPITALSLALLRRRIEERHIEHYDGKLPPGITGFVTKTGEQT
jgi:hypothetical protein